MKAYAGIDLHSSNNYLGIINDNDKRLYGRRISNDLNLILWRWKGLEMSLRESWLNQLTIGTGW